ncbi:MAG: hypothetical protein K0U62_02485 [Actinomycetia bacterium]|nr:hypothetical protein [Actinomycetes bacterium]
MIDAVEPIDSDTEPGSGAQIVPTQSLQSADDTAGQDATPDDSPRVDTDSDSTVPADDDRPKMSERLAAAAAGLQDGAQKASAVTKTAVAAGTLAATVAGGAGVAAATPAAAAGAPATLTQSAAKARNAPGAAKLDKMCRGSDSGICERPKWSEMNLSFDAVVIGRYVNVAWPEIKTVGGWRPSDPYPDHPSGRAVDIMMPNGGPGKDKKLGDAIVKEFQRNADDFGIEYILWHQRSWQAGEGINKWSRMADRGSASANHIDHIHITVKGDKSTLAKQMIELGVTAALGRGASESAGTKGDGDVLNEAEVTRTIVATMFSEPTSN